MEGSTEATATEPEAPEEGSPAYWTAQARENCDEDESSDEEENTTEFKWRLKREKGLESITVEYDKAQTYMKQIAEEEMKVVIQKLQQAMETEDPSLKDMLKMWLGPYIKFLWKTCNLMARKLNKGKIDIFDIKNFMKVELSCMFLNTSPTNLFAKEFKDAYAFFVRGLSYERYKEVLNLMDQSPYDTNPGEVDKLIVDMENQLKICSICYVEDVSIIAIDDDKIKATKRLARSLGLVAKKIAKSFGPVAHCAVSVVTQLFLGSVLEKQGLTVDDCVQDLLTRFTDKSHFKFVNMTNTITRDRGYTYRSSTATMLGLGAEVHGTRKRENNFPFVFGKRPKENQKWIPEQGYAATYWAKARVKAGAREASLTGCASRKNSRVTLLESSLPACQPGFYTYIRNPMKDEEKHPIENESSADDKEKTKNDFHRILTNSNLVYLTEAQASPEWFTLRLFRITSSVAANMIKRIWTSMQDLEEDQLQSIANLRTIIHDENIDKAPEEIEVTKELKLYKLPQLKEIAKNNLEGSFSTMNKSNLIEKLTEEIMQGNLSMEQVKTGSPINHSGETDFDILLKCWFMRPFSSKGLYIGKVNEDRVKKLFLTKAFADAKLQLLSLKEMGLVVNKAVSKYFATSVDGLISYKDEYGHVRMALLEIKTRSGANSIGKIKEIRRLFGLYVECDSKTSNLHKLVPDEQYRVQLLHHCSVFNVFNIFYIESTVNRIVYMAQITYTADELFAYQNGFILPLVKDKIEPLVKLIVQDKEPPADTRFGWAVDWYTVCQNYFLSEKLYRIATDEGQLVRANSILPTIVHMWNYLKGGVDIYSRYVSNLPNPHRQLKLIGRLNIRVFMTLLHQSNTTFKLFEYRRKFGLEVPSLKHLRDRMSAGGNINHNFIFKVLYCLDAVFSTSEVSVMDEDNLVPVNTEEATTIQVSRAIIGTRGLRRV